MATNPTETTAFGVAILGCGLAGRFFHAPHVAVTRGLETSVLMQRSDALEPGFAQLAPAARLVHSVEEAAASNDTQLAIVATPDATHFEYGLQLLRAGKHVLIDKPLAESSAQAAGLLRAAKIANRVCMPYQNRRYDADFRTVTKLLRAGTLGRPVEYEAHFDRFRPDVVQSWKELDRGSLANLGPHLIDQAVFLFGEPTHVSADVAILRPGGVTDDYFEVQLHYDWALSENEKDSAGSSGRLKGIVEPPRKAILKSSILAADNDLRYVLHGTKGSFVKRGIDQQEARLRSGGVVLPSGDGWGEEDPQWHGQLTIVKEGKTCNETLPSERGCYGQLYSNLLTAMASLDPVAAQEVSPRQALATMLIMELARKSAAAGGGRLPFEPMEGF